MLQTSPSPLATAPRLTARGLACRRGSRRLFENFDLELRAGEIVWVRGRNGRGKTSLLRLISGLAVPDGGVMLFDGAARADASALARRIVFIGHANALKEDLTVAESLAFLLGIHGRACDAASVTPALERWDMTALAAAPVRTLSQGQRRRVALARLAVDRDASLWVLDEPFDALDSDGVICLNALLADNLRRGGSVLLTGHPGAWASALPLREFDLDRCAC